MKLDAVDLFDDDIRQYNSADSFAYELDYEDVKLSKEVPLVIKYDYVDLDMTPYNFLQEFSLRDTQEYFRMMKQISSSTINTLSADARRYHFYRSEVKGRLKEMMQRIVPDAVSSNQIVYHFALYNDKDSRASRETGTRSPRIYFILGTNGFIYILFFDPYHEINP